MVILDGCLEGVKTHMLQGISQYLIRKTLHPWAYFTSVPYKVSSVFPLKKLVAPTFRGRVLD